MAESRDRLSRRVDIAALYGRTLAGAPGSRQELESALFGSPRRSLTTMTTRTASIGLRSGGLYGPGYMGRGSGGIGVATTRGQNEGGGRANPVRTTAPRANPLRTQAQRARENSPIVSVQRGNTGTARGRASNSSSVLPVGFPRTPLRDITHHVRATERRQEALGGGGGQEIGTPMPVATRFADSSESPALAHLKHTNLKTPAPTIGKKLCPSTVGKVPKILREIAKQDAGDSELTPQKKLLNSIDAVEKIVKEELQKLKRTPTARRAEREKRVRTLLSMR